MLIEQLTTNFDFLLRLIIIAIIFGFLAGIVSETISKLR